MGELREVKVYLSEEDSRSLYSSKSITSPEDAVDVMRELLGKQDREFFCVVNLDSQNRPINYHVVAIGTINQSMFEIGNVFKTAILSNAAKIMVFHNHPSGEVIPSFEDISATQRIIDAGQIMGVKVIDHVIIGGRNKNYYSMFKNDPDLFTDNLYGKDYEINTVGEERVTDVYGTESKKDVFRKAVAEQFVKLLDPDNPTDEMAWIKEWNGSAAMPENTLTGKRYRGINRLCLFFTAAERGYKDPRWATMATLRKIPGARVKKGEHGTNVEFWFVRDFGLDKTDPNFGKSYTFAQAEEMVKNKGRLWSEFVPYPRYYSVFNAEQCIGISPMVAKDNNEVKQEDLVTAISESMNVKILNDGGDRAFYRPTEDTVHLPKPSSFVTDYAYNATALHELAHATGAANRLSRNLSGLFGNEDYAQEELVAEITSCMTAVNFAKDDSGVDEYLKGHAENHKRYVKSWAKAITSNPNCLVQAVKCAEIATDFLELHGGLIDISTFNCLHGHDVTVIADKANHIKVSYLKQFSDNSSITLETHNSISENNQSQSRIV